MFQRFFSFFALLCIAAIALACLWLVAPNFLAPQSPQALAQSGETSIERPLDSDTVF